MFTILWILFAAAVISFGVSWLADNNGEVIINWFGYQLTTDTLTALFLVVLLMLIIAIFSYLVARIFALNFPNIFKIFFKKTYVSRLETIIKRHNKAFDELTKLLQNIDEKDVRNAKNLRKKFATLVKNKQINDFLSNKIEALEGDSDFVKIVKKVKEFRFKNLFRKK